jgi:anti-anti-sigma factor
MTPRRRSRANRRRREIETPFPERRTDVAREVEVRFAAQGIRLLVSLANELVAENCFGVRDAILRTLDAATVEQVVLNFELVPFVDSTAIGMLLDLQIRLSEKRKRLVLANVPDQVESLLETLMLQRVFDIRTM